MAFVALTTTETATGKPITQALMRKIKDNFDDLDQRAGSRTGVISVELDDAAKTGWVLLGDDTIGNAASGATNRANADTEDLFKLIWDKFSATEAPLFDELGASVSRGVSAQADFDANRRIQLGTIAGRVLGVVGAGSGLTVRGIGDVVGAQTVGLGGGNNGSHFHVTHPNDGGGGTGEIGGASGGATGNANTDSSGSGTGHNNMQPTVFLYVWCKL